MHKQHLALLSVVFLSIVLAPLARAQDAEEPWPPDAVDVSATLLQMMYGDTDDLGNVAFAPDGQQEIEGGENGAYADFKNGEIVFLQYENDAPGDVYNARVTGLFNLSDAFRRTAALRFMADYHVEKDAISITRSAVATASPPLVPIEVYLVPSEAINESEAATMAFNDWDTLYTFAREHAYKPDDEPEQHVWYVMSFFKSKLPPDAEMDVIVSDKRSARRSSQNDVASQQEILDYGGWRVHVFAMRFKPCSVRNRFYINYYYTPGADVPEEMRERIHLARYDSNE